MPLLRVFAGLMVFVVFLVISTETRKPGFRPAEFEAASKGTPEDPIARARQEWMQLRDPVTNQIPPGIRAKELAFAKSLPSKETLLKSGLQKGEVLTWASRGPVNQGGRT
ncbi:MAG TPA: hypothetical protein VI758_03650, partial [Bacteroidota bacterium]